MVQFRVWNWWSQLSSNRVSIPWWYNSERVKAKLLSLWRWVSIPWWYNSEQWWINTYWPCFNVSIPWWYNSEFTVWSGWVIDSSGFNSLVVQFRVSFVQSLSWFCPVSIPWWYNSERLTPWPTASLIRFQFLGGTIQSGLAFTFKSYLSYVSIPWWYNSEFFIKRRTNLIV